MSASVRVQILGVLLTLVWLQAACGKDDSSSTAPSTPGTATEFFNGDLAVNASIFYSFTVTNAGNVSITLASLNSGNLAAASRTTVGLGLGIPEGTGCALSSSITTVPGFVAQLTSSQSPGIYCVNIADVGTLTATLKFSVRIVHP